eukprot:403341052
MHLLHDRSKFTMMVTQKYQELFRSGQFDKLSQKLQELEQMKSKNEEVVVQEVSQTQIQDIEECKDIPTQESLAQDMIPESKQATFNGSPSLSGIMNAKLENPEDQNKLQDPQVSPLKIDISEAKQVQDDCSPTNISEKDIKQLSDSSICLSSARTQASTTSYQDSYYWLKLYSPIVKIEKVASDLEKVLIFYDEKLVAVDFLRKQLCDYLFPIRSTLGVCLLNSKIEESCSDYQNSMILVQSLHFLTLIFEKVQNFRNLYSFDDFRLIFKLIALCCSFQLSEFKYNEISSMLNSYLQVIFLKKETNKVTQTQVKELENLIKDMYFVGLNWREMIDKML